MEKHKEERPAGGSRLEKKPKKKSRLTRQQKVLIAVAAVLAVVLVGVLVWQSLFVKPQLPSGSRQDPEKENAIDYGEGSSPMAGGERKSEDWYTVLILGHPAAGQL